MAIEYKQRSIESTIDIHSLPEKIWENITNVKIEQFSDPLIFRLLDIPKPLKAEIISEGAGGSRVAYFNTGKRFLQRIIVWKPFMEYSFSFNPEKGFTVCYFFDLSEGFFRISEGTYLLTRNEQSVTLKLITTYGIYPRVYLLMGLPARLILRLFQRYLLTSIKKNSE